MLIQGYSDFSLNTPEPIIKLGVSIWNAHFRLDTDVSELFPYINAAVEGATYYDKPHYITFPLRDCHCSIYGETVAAGAFEDRDQALEFVSHLIDFLNDISSRKDSIKPNHKKYRHQPVLEVFKLLPRTNCKECGFTTCMAFAAAISRREVYLVWTFRKRCHRTARLPYRRGNPHKCSSTRSAANLDSRRRVF